MIVVHLMTSSASKTHRWSFFVAWPKGIPSKTSDLFFSRENAAVATKYGGSRVRAFFYIWIRQFKLFECTTKDSTIINVMVEKCRVKKYCPIPFFQVHDTRLKSKTNVSSPLLKRNLQFSTVFFLIFSLERMFEKLTTFVLFSLSAYACNSGQLSLQQLN